jgi:hypothetical protein
MLQLDTLTEDHGLQSTFGIKQKGSLLNIENFDICLSLLHDPMHVLVEGIFINELKNLFNYLINSNLKKVNTLIRDVLYPFIDKNNRPHTIEKKHLQNGRLS